jgi:hypothetical protein
MTESQKIAKVKFKQAIAYRQKTGVSLKEAFAHIYGKKKVSGTGNSYIFKVYDRNSFGEPINNSFKKVTINASSQVNAKDKLYKKYPSSRYFCELQDSYTNVKKRLGALPIGFKGSIFNIPFKIVNQYDIYNDVSAIMEDTDNGNRIVTFDGKGSAKDKAEAIVSYINKVTQGKYIGNKELYSRMLKFATNMQKEVKDFNAGKKKTIKKEPLKILAPKNIVTTKKRLPSVIKLINKTIDKVYKKSKSKKKVAKKVVRKVVKKKSAPKKVAKKKLTKQDYDKRYQAKKPGKRTSASGNTYYENRANRSDRGKLLGIEGNLSMSLIKRLEGINKEIEQRQNVIANVIQNKTYFVNKNGKSWYPKFMKLAKSHIAELKKHKTEIKKLV